MQALIQLHTIRAPLLLCFQPNRSPFICCEMDGSCFLWSSRWMSLCFPLAAGKMEGWASFCIRAKWRKSFIRIDFFLLRQVAFAGKFELRSNKLWKKDWFLFLCFTFSLLSLCHMSVFWALPPFSWSFMPFFQQHWFSHQPPIQYKYCSLSALVEFRNQTNRSEFSAFY